MTQTTTTRPAYILWDISNRNNWQIAAKGTYEECERSAAEDCLNPEMAGMEIHANEIKDSWNNPVSKIHYDIFIDGTTEDRPMTPEEIAADDDTDQDGDDGYMGDE